MKKPQVHWRATCFLLGLYKDVNISLQKILRTHASICWFTNNLSPRLPTLCSSHTNTQSKIFCKHHGNLRNLTVAVTSEHILCSISRTGISFFRFSCFALPYRIWKSIKIEDTLRARSNLKSSQWGLLELETINFHFFLSRLKQNGCPLNLGAKCVFNVRSWKLGEQLFWKEFVCRLFYVLGLC